MMLGELNVAGLSAQLKALDSTQLHSCALGVGGRTVDAGKLLVLPRHAA